MNVQTILVRDESQLIIQFYFLSIKIKNREILIVLKSAINC